VRLQQPQGYLGTYLIESSGGQVIFLVVWFMGWQQHCGLAFFIRNGKCHAGMENQGGSTPYGMEACCIPHFFEEK
jgi:hypothetical protein